MGFLSTNLFKMAKNIQIISIITTTSIVLLVVILALAACSGQETRTPMKATWIKSQVVGDSVYIPVNDVNKDKIVHFNVPVTAGSEMAFMAYNEDGKLHVRANVCPPCRSIGFSLSKYTLVCDTCQTTFEAKTGEGISGACVGYPKAAVPYEISDGQIVMRGNDLLSAYQTTLEPGLP